MNITEIADSIYWSSDKRVFFKSINPEYTLLLEYLNNTTLPYIDSEISKLKSFKEITDSNDIVTIEDYIVKNLYGFNQYNDGKVYAYIAGVTDFGISVLYNLEASETLLKHVYGEPQEKYTVNLSSLIKLLEQSKLIISTLTAL